MNLDALYFDRDGQPMARDAWAQRLEDPAAKRVALNQFEDGTEISTTWLGLNHRWDDGPPLIFETRVFDPARHALDAWTRRYSTEAEAHAGHDATVEAYRRAAGHAPPDPA